MIISLIIISAPVLIIYVFMQQAKFGRTPGKNRLAKIHKSPHYKNKAFQNLNLTPSLTEGATYGGILKEVVFGDKKQVKPTQPIPSQKTNLLTLDPKEDILVWFGHSSYFIQIDGKRILVDPVLSGSASPVWFTTKAFPGSDVYTAEDIPEIDYLFISHDHWDHLDHKTISKLKPKIKQVICSLGTGEHLERWGFDKTIIREEDWNSTIHLNEGFITHTVPARHFSGRGFKRNQALWTAFVLQTPSMNLFIGGDSGYDTHFSEIGKSFGPFDLVILENGQYNINWKYIHMQPEEVLMAAKDLMAKKLLPVHSGKFALANHAWNEPLKRITDLNKDSSLKLITPMIGQKVHLKDESQTFNKWWESIN